MKSAMIRSVTCGGAWITKHAFHSDLPLHPYCLFWNADWPGPKTRIQDAGLVEARSLWYRFSLGVMAQGNSHEFCYRGGTGWKIAEKRVRVRFVTGTFDPAVLYCCGFHCRTFAISDCECNLGCCDDILTVSIPHFILFRSTVDAVHENWSYTSKISEFRPFVSWSKEASECSM